VPDTFEEILTSHADVAGEYMRSNIIEEQAGIPLALDLQVFDIETCEPLSGAYLEIWRKLSSYLRDTRRKES
jgi:protocatechuate 3,4-dioxygenase beta subunit